MDKNAVLRWVFIVLGTIFTCVCIGAYIVAGPMIGRFIGEIVVPVTIAILCGVGTYVSTKKSSFPDWNALGYAVLAFLAAVSFLALCSMTGSMDFIISFFELAGRGTQISSKILVVLIMLYPIYRAADWVGKRLFQQNEKNEPPTK